MIVKSECELLTRKTWHGDLVGALDLSDNTVSRDRGDKRGEDV